MLTKLIDVYHQYQLKIEGLIIDNGSENAYLHCFDELTKIYRCNPYNPTDKPRVENVNRLIRYWIPKSVSIDLFEEDQIQFYCYLPKWGLLPFSKHLFKYEKSRMRKN